MSSLRRFPSLECAEYAAPLLSSGTRKISRRLSFPVLTFCKPHGLPPLPSRKPHHGSSDSFCSPSCGHQQEDTNRKLTSFRSMPVWSADYEGDCSVLPASPSISRKESLDMEDSVVYRELCESIHLQVPGGNGCMLRSSVRDVDNVREGEDNLTELSSYDVQGRPISLRMLKRRGRASPKSETSLPSSFNRQQVTGGPLTESLLHDGLTDSLLFDVPGSVHSAFASLLFMMESLQQHTLRLRRVLMSEADTRFQVMLERVHQEVQETFLWLFQRVFACTPKLMLLTMMLLADFAVHSMGEHVALAVTPMGEPPTCAIESSLATGAISFDLSEAVKDVYRFNGEVCAGTHSYGMQESIEPCFCEGGAGDGVAKAVKIGGEMEGDAAFEAYVERAAMTSQDDTHTRLNDTCEAEGTAIFREDNFLKPDSGLSTGHRNLDEHRVLTAMWQQVVSKEPASGPLTNTRHILVAPVRAPALEADDYACYDRTDLKYQHELSRDPSNPLLLANYAQFLHVVRHDHNRAEELYKRAVQADPVDGELRGKYASFLWVAKEDVAAADEAYKAALAVDPSNAYHAGSYAHFLWNLGVDQDQDDVSTPNTAYHEFSTS